MMKNRYLNYHGLRLFFRVSMTSPLSAEKQM